MKAHRILLWFMILSLVCSWGSMGVTYASAAEMASSTKTVDFTSPAILADVGDEIVLSEYNVMFDAINVTNAEQIHWTSGTATIINGTVSVEKAGVYTLMASTHSEEKTVYIVAKNKNEKEYVLFDIDYSDINQFSELTEMGYIVAEQGQGFEMKMQNGALAILGASTHTQNTYARLLFPSWLSDFGNYSITAQAKITNAPTDTRYFSLVYRAQNEREHYPIYVASFRANTTRSNGHDLNMRYYKTNSLVDWHTGVATSHNTRLDDGKFHKLNVSVYGNNVQTMFDDKILITSDYIGAPGESYNYGVGGVGYLVRGVDVEIASTRIVLTTGKKRQPVVNTDSFNSNVILPASVITFIDSTATLEALGVHKNKPATAIFNVDDNLDITDQSGAQICSLDKAVGKMGDSIIPAFYVKTEQAADAVIEYITDNELYDVFVVSDNAELIQKVREECVMVRGVLDFSKKNIAQDQLYLIRKQTNECGARVCIIPDNLANKKNVEYLQRLFMAVWVETAGDPVSQVSAITSGASGILTYDIDALISAYTKFFKNGTMTRTVGIIGHQGAYSLAQPNTLAGSLLAYNLGATAIENDIYLSRDGVIIAMHDSTLDAATNGTGKISSYTYEELKRFVVDQNASVATEPIATLEDYFKAFKGLDAQLIVEIKSSDKLICQKLVELINKYDIADQVNVISFSESQIQLLKSLKPEISTGYLTGSITASESMPESSLYHILNKVQNCDSTYNPSYSVGPLGPNVIRAAQDHGINIYPYTINSREQLDAYFMYGTYAITTNYTQYFSDIIKEIYTDKQVYYSIDSVIEPTVVAQTYARKTTKVTNAELVLLEGDDIFSYRDGKIIASSEGKATLMLSYKCTGVGNSPYYVVSEPFAVEYSATNPAVALKKLQSEVEAVQDDGSYCPALWEKFDIARKANVDTLTEGEIWRAINDIETLGGHEFSATASNIQATPADCNNAATYYVQCYHCHLVSDKFTVSVGQALGHKFNKKDSGKVASEATCRQKQLNYVQCDNCSLISDTKTVSVGVLAKHKYGKYVGNNNATCCKDATKSAMCIWCNQKNTKTIKGSALGHADSTKVFNDVRRGNWYVEAINYNYTHKFITGISANKFGVNTAVTRGMFITILARIAGVNTNDNDVATQFSDVTSGKYYTAAVKWGSDNGIVNGISKTTFAPNQAIQRQQLCVMIVNFSKRFNIKLTASKSEIKFRDATLISGYAKTAIATCQRANIVNGYESGNGYVFKPKDTASRAETAQIFYKFYKNFVLN